MNTSTRRGLMCVAGITYRLVRRGGLHLVIRVLDDRPVGTFRHDPVVAIIWSAIEPEALLAVAREALHAGKLV